MYDCLPILLDKTEQDGPLIWEQNGSVHPVVRCSTKTSKRYLHRNKKKIEDKHTIKTFTEKLNRRSPNRIQCALMQSDIDGGAPEDKLINSRTLINSLPGMAHRDDSWTSCIISHGSYWWSLKALVWSNAPRVWALNLHTSASPVLSILKTVDSVSRRSYGGDFSDCFYPADTEYLPPPADLWHLSVIRHLNKLCTLLWTNTRRIFRNWFIGKQWM